MGFFKNLFNKRGIQASEVTAPAAPADERPKQADPNEQAASDSPVYECINCDYTSNQAGGCPNCGIPLRVAEWKNNL